MQIYGCECNKQLYDISRTVANQSEISPKILKFINKYSTDLIASDFDLGPGDDDENYGKVDVIVTELFDSSFFGEKVISTLIHAIRNFLKPGGVVIPYSADIRFTVIFFRLL